ncbi:hypothetical protein B4067_2245 [Bacillus subtilis subsp. subtilis]|uniref:Uncharacterized protein n=1 Tax=Bacillus subtilis subsp. subtilis TaxID=135461 RepID=A0ABD3ZQP3_BACIU|nr:hypothetical protein B4067_2245 [Bacillus subtilis subsp. subtilis]
MHDMDAHIMLEEKERLLSICIQLHMTMQLAMKQVTLLTLKNMN